LRWRVYMSGRGDGEKVFEAPSDAAEFSVAHL
jgi:hypothetical protein